MLLSTGPSFQPWHLPVSWLLTQCLMLLLPFHLHHSGLYPQTVSENRPWILSFLRFLCWAYFHSNEKIMNTPFYCLSHLVMSQHPAKAVHLSILFLPLSRLSLADFGPQLYLQLLSQWKALRRPLVDVYRIIMQMHEKAICLRYKTFVGSQPVNLYKKIVNSFWNKCNSIFPFKKTFNSLISHCIGQPRL